jgi:acetoacetate decarboxylase
MFKLDLNVSHAMPAHFVPRYTRSGTSGWYHDVTSMVISFIVNREKLAVYLPERFEVAKETVVTVTYSCNKQIDWLATATT